MHGVLKDTLRNATPGLLLCAALAVAAMGFGNTSLLKNQLHLGPLLLVILLGIAVKSVVRLPRAASAGIQAAQKPILRWAVAGLGFRLSLPELWQIGLPALIVVVVSTLAALWFGWWVADRMRVDHKLGLLLGVGSSICGASAIIAADSVVQGKRSETAYALGIITLLGTLGIVLYPVLSHLLAMTDFGYGVWSGASLHEMAQVVAAGMSVSDEAGRVATVVKLARICLLAPVVFYLAWAMRRHHEGTGQARVSAVPWFLICFICFVALNSLSVLSADTVKLAQQADLWLLCIGMAGVGLQTGFSDLRGAGWRPILAGMVQWVFLAALSYGLVALLFQ